MKTLRLLSTVLTLAWLAGCATTDLPEIGRDLRDRDPTRAIEIGGATPLPDGESLQFQTETINGVPMACTANRFALEHLVIAARANTESLDEVIAAYREAIAEAGELLRAGQAREDQADRLRSLYLDEARRSRFLEIAGAAGSGLALLLLGGLAI